MDIVVVSVVVNSSCKRCTAYEKSSANVRNSMCKWTVYVCVCLMHFWSADGKRNSLISQKACTVLSENGGVISLYPLAKQDGTHRFTTEYAGIIFNFNPCLPLLDTNHNKPSKQLLQAILPNQENHEGKQKHIVLGSSRSVLFPRYKISICPNNRGVDHPLSGCPLTELINTQSIGSRTERNSENDQKLEIGVSQTDEGKIWIDDNNTNGVHNEQSSHDGTDNEEDADDNVNGLSSALSPDRSDVEDDDDKTVLTAKPGRKRMKLPQNVTGVIGFRSRGRCSGLRTHILLQCDPGLYDPDATVFQVLPVQCPGHLYFLLTHRCCCEDLCHKYVASLLGQLVDISGYKRMDPSSLLRLHDQSSYYGNTSSEEAQTLSSLTEPTAPTETPKFMWLIAVVNFGVVGSAICIAGLCCRKGSTLGTTPGPYSYLPDLGELRTQALHGSRLTIGSSMDSIYPQPPIPPPKSAEYLDYSSPIAKSNKLPQLSNCVISSGDLEIGQRLGGGVFGDTYLAEWKDRAVAAKRLTVGVHQGQLDENDHKWITMEVEKISKQRHKHLVAVFGVCLETRQPHVISEYVECESLKDQLIKRADDSFSWLRKIKICLQAAEGLVFLHSAKPAILHRDLRCANILIDKYDRAKVVDFCTTKVVQRLREGCNVRGCYCKKNLSALPASIRWTAPELLRNPQADENNHDIINPACDVYSYAMVLWEVASHCDPFEDIPDENEVTQLVLDCVRPRVDILHGMIAQLRELMVTCWEDSPEQRPTFKQIVVILKSCLQIITKTSHKPRTRNNSSTTYLKSALNMSS